MPELSALTFSSPWLLTALVGLPVLWWLLRLTPPAPRRLSFPPLRLLLGLMPRQETPLRTPWWLLLLRLVLAALLIVAFAQPRFELGANRILSGPLLIAIDDGWTAAAHWESRRQALRDAMARAERAGVPVYLLTTAPRADMPALAGALSPAEALAKALALTPQPWATDRAGATAALATLSAPIDEALWLGDGVGGSAADEAFMGALTARAPLTVLRDPPGRSPLALGPGEVEAGEVGASALSLVVRRLAGEPARTLAVRATDGEGRLVARQEVTLAAGEATATTAIRLPTDLLNRIERVTLDGEASAAATLLIDERWRRRPVGLVAGGADERAQPLLGELYYLDRALAPSTDLRRGSVEELLQRPLAVLVLADVGALTAAEEGLLEAWVGKGGVLLRFAGERLAVNTDSLLPVRLRPGERSLGGAMSWTKPLALAPFPNSSPFAGLPVPGDVAVRRQVLAEPELDLPRKTWAQLADGTPLVTGAKHGAGWLVLVHTTANAEWSNLALSGLFVDMLERLIGLSRGIAGGGEDNAAELPPLKLLDGFGHDVEPAATVEPIALALLARNQVGPSHPPGYYGTQTARRALNLGPGITALTALALPPGASDYGARAETDLRAPLLVAAALLWLLDMLLALLLRGVLAVRPRAGMVLPILAASMMLATAQPAKAQENSPDAFALDALRQTSLAYVRTGVGEVDRVSEAGLQGLSLVLRERTAIEAGAPVGVDLEGDELAFFPLLYWPVAEAQTPPSPAALRRVGDYLRNGGMILFDTRDRAAASLDGASAGALKLRQLLHGLDLPPLTPVPPDHVLTKSFYLLRDFPGRWIGAVLWVEPGQGSVNDGVSSVVIGGNDYAAAWAVDDLGAPLFAAVPGGERQREMAYRFGVNLVMYALTGNYKSDQVHVPAILERLGQ